jgi:hypothetical protein
MGIKIELFSSFLPVYTINNSENVSPNVRIKQINEEKIALLLKLILVIIGKTIIEKAKEYINNKYH